MKNKMLVFNIQFKFVQNISSEQENDFFDGFIKNAIEANNLQFGGGGVENGWRVGVIEAESGIDATENDRQVVKQWLSDAPLILEYAVGPLVKDRLINERDMKDLEDLNNEGER